MENPPQLQLLQAAVFLSAGIAAGLLYDVAMAVRRCFGRGAGETADVLFAMVLCSGLFVLGMLVGGGVRIFMGVCCLLGGVCYKSICSAWVLPCMCRGLGWCKLPFMQAKKFLKTGKKLFPKRWSWSTMNGYSFRFRQHAKDGTRRGETTGNEGMVDGTGHTHRTVCADALRGETSRQCGRS